MTYRFNFVRIIAVITGFALFDRLRSLHDRLHLCRALISYRLVMRLRYTNAVIQHHFIRAKRDTLHLLIGLVCIQDFDSSFEILQLAITLNLGYLLLLKVKILVQIAYFTAQLVKSLYLMKLT